MIDYAKHTGYTDPGEHAALLDGLPADVPSIAEAVRNVLLHYRASGLELTAEHLLEVNNRWVERILAADQSRHPKPLAEPRPYAEHVAGCCRDYTLLSVAALRHKGIPARSRIGFASYFAEGFHHDHVVTEYWDGSRWIWTDTQLDPADTHWAFDTTDMPRPGIGAPFATAAQVWTAIRGGGIDGASYGVDPDLPIRGPWFVFDYVLLELAHRQGDEVLLWDGWGIMSDRFGDDLSTGDPEHLALVDRIAELLLAADDEDAATAGAAEKELAALYAADARLRPGDKVACMTPNGDEYAVDLRTRESVKVAANAHLAVAAPTV
ncbi:MAG: transglutaminase domain-containing protein [Hamadaea sp.]|nr:transglutaminase domain-containing protein [Hamadaea sp.]